MADELINSLDDIHENYKRMAEQAVKRQERKTEEDLERWAEQVIDDVKDADD